MFANIFHAEPEEKKNILPIHLSWQAKKINLVEIILDTLGHND